ncbi:hypothetical protein AVEN_115552-1 [Araneus ventricosus]|uniref:Uncharacterized protein n=1 Tax=Araneus ventricosus TaxID=182803 RepID=A0A4Y2CKD0_ARAVE|nr:hypothetical protein AVEN_115552-1 [Araneus ventricosus]
MFRHNIAKLRFGSKRRILLLYSHDCNEHKNFVIAFIQYLIKHCHVEVSTIYDELPIDWNPDEKPVDVIPNVNECNPQEWIKKKYNECDIIMCLISAGLFYTLDSKQSLPIQKFHEWRRQLVWATNFILLELLNSAEDIRKKKICKVCFPYSSKKYIPDTLRPGFGECYVLPQEMNNLINFMHDSRECFLCSKFYVTNFESSFEGTDLSNKMRDVQAAVDSNSHIRIIRPLRDTASNDMNFIEEPVNLDEMSTTSNSSDENSDAFINFLSGSISKSISEERCGNLSSSGLSDNIRPMVKSEKFDLAIDEPVGDSDSEESDLLYYPPKLHSEIGAKYVIEDILNKN